MIDIRTLDGRTMTIDPKEVGLCFSELPSKRFAVQVKGNNVVFNIPISEETYNNILKARTPKKTTKK